MCAVLSSTEIHKKKNPLRCNASVCGNRVCSVTDFHRTEARNRGNWLIILSSLEFIDSLGTNITVCTVLDRWYIRCGVLFSFKQSNRWRWNANTLGKMLVIRTHAISADSEIVFLCLQRKKMMLSAVAHVVRLWKQTLIIIPLWRLCVKHRGNVFGALFCFRSSFCGKSQPLGPSRNYPSSQRSN